MSNQHRLGQLQIEIMRILWKRGEASAVEVHESLLEQRDLALNTTKTMLRKMDERGVVAHREQGRQFIYRAKIAESDVRRGMVGDLLHRIFAGDSLALVNHLIDEGQVNTNELRELREQLDRALDTKEDPTSCSSG